MSHKHPKKTGGDFRFPWWGLQSSCNCGSLLCKSKYGLFFIFTFYWCSVYCRLCFFMRHLLYRQINSSFAKDIHNRQSVCCFLWLGWNSCLTEQWGNAHTFLHFSSSRSFISCFMKCLLLIKAKQCIMDFRESWNVFIPSKKHFMQLVI